MTVDELVNMLDSIDGNENDPEVAHGNEDEMLHAYVAYIAGGNWTRSHARKLAEMIRVSLDRDNRTRWYA